ncbi:hypothetical protein A2U01_0048524, partial [Trifolium medium]|nr:hypothetical protein [Trifolium medium]
TPPSGQQHLIWSRSRGCPRGVPQWRDAKDSAHVTGVGKAHCPVALMDLSHQSA